MFKRIIIFGAVFFMLLSCASTGKVDKVFEYQERAVSINAGDHMIPAVVTTPVVNGSGKFPVVVMLHGYGSNKDEAGDGYKLFAPELAKKGIASVRIDFMGCGDSTVDHVNFDLDVGVAEAIAAANYAAALPQANPKKIGIMGWSKGGTIALLAAGESSIFKSVVTWAGALKLVSVYTPEAYEIAKRDGFYVETFEWREPLNMSLKAFEIAQNTDVLKVFSNSSAPVLAINGSEDTTVLPENAANIKAASSNKKSRVFILPGADHTFNIFSGDMTAFNALMAETAAWFQETL
jgi:dipeptidyl aminopeptidase/acylaminoacyl peptidase